MDKFLMYAALLAPIILISAALLVATIARNMAHRKAGKQRGIFE